MSLIASHFLSELTSSGPVRQKTDSELFTIDTTGDVEGEPVACRPSPC